MTKALLAWQATLPAPPKTAAAVKSSTGETMKPKGKKPESPAKAAPDRAKAFQRWDKDRDGLLTLPEYTNGLTQKERAPQRFQAFDKNADGKVSREEFGAQ